MVLLRSVGVALAGAGEVLPMASSFRTALLRMLLEDEAVPEARAPLL